MPFFEAIAAQSRANARRPIILQPNAPPLTHAEALHRIAQLSAALAHQGLRPGDRLAVKVEKSPDAILLYLACLQSRTVYVPINPAFRTTETAHILSDATPAALICEPGHDPTPGVRTIPLPDLATQAASLPPTTTRPTTTNDLAVILYTSGTTGRPKGAMLGQSNILANAEALAHTWRFTPDDVLLHAVPLFHSHGLFVSLSCTLLSGSTLFPIPVFTPDQVIALLPQATVFMGVPTMYTRLLASPALTPHTCRNIRLFACGSAPLSPATHAAFAARTGHAIIERYGMSETAVNASNPIGAPRPGTVGPALPTVEIRTQGHPGPVQVRGPHVFQGYWNNPDQTAAAFTPDGWFDTGDIGQLEDGTLTLVGRAKDLIITGGYNVYPLEVEQTLQDLPGVHEAAVIGLPHPDYGEAVTAIIVPHPGPPPDEQTLITAIKARLAPYKAPKRILFTQSLPRNALGKILKADLQAKHKNLFPPPSHGGAGGG